MGTCKPLSITRKQDINKMCKELISARQALKVENHALELKDLKIFSCKSTADKYFSLACLNSKLAFWLWTVVGDGFHVTNRLLSVFSPGNDSVAYDTLVTLGQDFSEKIKKYPIISINSGKTIIS